MNRYLVGVYDKSAKKVKLYQAPTHLMSRTVKALKNRTKATPSLSEKALYRQQRTDLGQAFGSKKALAAIRATERNEIDVSAMQGVTSHVQHDIDAGTVALPSQGVYRLYCQLGRVISFYSIEMGFCRRNQSQHGFCTTYSACERGCQATPRRM